MHRRFILLLLFCVAAGAASGQALSFKDTVAAYNTQRININRTGMKVLGGWGIVSAAAGGIGYFTATDDEWKYFHGMNALWGAVNTGIAAFGLAGVRKEMAAKLNYQQAYDRYRKNKRLYLINAGLDVLYIGAGIALNEYGRTAKNDVAMFQGFGKSIAIQGIILLLFDNVMYAAHQRSNSNWYILMSEIRFTGNSVGFIHTF